MIAYIYFAFIWYIGPSYVVRDGWSAIMFVKHVKTVFVQVLSCITQCSADAWIVALLWKLLQMPSCSANSANLDKNNCKMLYKIYCCAAIHGRIWINNVLNESRIIILSWTEISFVIFFCGDILSQTRVFFYFLLTLYTVHMQVS